MLLEDIKQHCAALFESLWQTNITNHFTEIQPDKRVPPYIDKLFKEAAIQWLVKTDQVSCYPFMILIILAYFGL